MYTARVSQKDNASGERSQIEVRALHSKVIFRFEGRGKKNRGKPGPVPKNRSAAQGGLRLGRCFSLIQQLERVPTMVLPQTLSVSRFRNAFDSCASLLKSWATRTGRQKSRRRARLLTDQCDSLEPRQLLTVVLESATLDAGILTVNLDNGNGMYFLVDVDLDGEDDHSGTLTNEQVSFAMPPELTEVTLRFF